MPRLYLTIAALLASGCGGPTRLLPPEVSADGAAETALETYDENGDGSLAPGELVKCPGLAHVLPEYDANRDGSLTKEEISLGISRWSEGKMGAASWPFQVRFNGRALEGAQVKIVPESFLGGAIKPASGTAAQGGHGTLGMAMDDLPANAPRRPLVQPGLYRVEITHPSVSIPAKFNAETTLGLEVSSYTLSPQGTVWDLKAGK